MIAIDPDDDDYLRTVIDADILHSLFVGQSGWHSVAIPAASEPADCEPWCRENCRSRWLNALFAFAFEDHAEAALFALFLT